MVNIVFLEIEVPNCTFPGWYHQGYHLFVSFTWKDAGGVAIKAHQWSLRSYSTNIHRPTKGMKDVPLIVQPQQQGKVQIATFISENVYIGLL